VKLYEIDALETDMTGKGWWKVKLVLEIENDRIVSVKEVKQ
jgi:hypothetical protein